MSKREREAIRGSMLFQEMFGHMCEGNLGCMSLLMNVVFRYYDNHSADAVEAAQNKFQLLMDLDDMNIRGEQIYVLWKYVCDFDLGKFVMAVKKRLPNVVEEVNRHMTMYNPPFAWLAVERGGSTSVRPFHLSPNQPTPELEINHEI